MTNLQITLRLAGDAFLLAMCLLNLIGVSVVVLPGYNPYKSPLIKWHARLVSHLYKKTPLLVHAALVSTFGLAVYYSYQSFLIYPGMSDRVHDAKESQIRAMISCFTFAFCLLLHKLSSFVVNFGPNRIAELESELDQIDTILNYTPPPKSLFKTLLGPTNTVLRREVEGLENVSTDTPHLFVMNHSLMGIEMGSFVDMLYREKDVYLRGLADNFHFAIPSPHAEFMRYVGAVRGTRSNVDALMESKQNILVYPGGGNEVLKHSSVPKYSLLWKERLGFARMAIKHGYPIMPCCAVGTEDFMDIMADIPTFRTGLTIPVIKPINPRKIQKVYFWFGKPIPTAKYKGDFNNDVFAREVRDKAKAEIERGIQLMLERQASDPQRYLVDHYLFGTRNQPAQDNNTSWIGSAISSSSDDNDDASVACENAKCEDCNVDSIANITTDKKTQ